MWTILWLVLICVATSSIKGKIDERANELQLSLDGIKARLYLTENRK
jgi:hypothetical protein